MKRHASRLIGLLVATAAIALPAGPAQAAPRYCKVASVTAAAHAVPKKGAMRDARRVTLCLLNRERARRGLRPLRLNMPLTRASLRHSRDMVRRRYFSHGNFVARILNARYAGRHQAWSLAENIAWGTGYLATPARTVRSWMRSPGHRANILNPRFRDVGIGIAPGAPTAVHAAVGAATYTTDFGRKG